VLVFGIIGALLIALDFSVAPILLGYVLGPMVEENFRRALVLSRGNMAVFIERPISAVFIGICTLLVLVQLGFWLRRVGMKKAIVVYNSPECAMEDA
jgi:TctA family transporter